MVQYLLHFPLFELSQAVVCLLLLLDGLFQSEELVVVDDHLFLVVHRKEGERGKSTRESFLEEPTLSSSMDSKGSQKAKENLDKKTRSRASKFVQGS